MRNKELGSKTQFSCSLFLISYFLFTILSNNSPLSLHGNILTIDRIRFINCCRKPFIQKQPPDQRFTNDLDAFKMT